MDFAIADELRRYYRDHPVAYFEMLAGERDAIVETTGRVIDSPLSLDDGSASEDVVLPPPS